MTTTTIDDNGKNPYNKKQYGNKKQPLTTVGIISTVLFSVFAIIVFIDIFEYASLGVVKGILGRKVLTIQQYEALINNCKIPSNSNKSLRGGKSGSSVGGESSSKKRPKKKKKKNNSSSSSSSSSNKDKKQTKKKNNKNNNVGKTAYTKENIKIQNLIDKTIMWKDVKPKRRRGEGRVCDEIFYKTNGVRPIYTKEQYMQLRKAYVDIVGEDKSTIPIPITDTSGLNFKYEIRQTDDGSGRGIYTKEKLKKGHLLYDAIQEGTFDNPKDYSKFLDLLPAYMACDVFYWSYASEEKDEVTGKDYIGITVIMDEGALVNTANHKDDQSSECDPNNKEQDCDCCDYAIRTIKKNEQLLEWYDDLYHTPKPNYYFDNNDNNDDDDGDGGDDSEDDNNDDGANDSEEEEEASEEEQEDEEGHVSEEEEEEEQSEEEDNEKASEEEEEQGSEEEEE